MLSPNFMPNRFFHYVFGLVCFMTINLRPHSSALISVSILNKSEPKNYERKLDPTFHSVTLTLKMVRVWYNFGVAIQNEDFSDLYVPHHWAIFISNNETLLNSGSCLFFEKFICERPGCFEDSSSSYPQNYTRFSVTNATRLNLASQTLSIAGGAWKLNSSPLYIQSCKLTYLHRNVGQAIGQIGLGLGGKAYQNFQTTNWPVFSIIFHSPKSAELIFGFNSSYVNGPKITTLPCDLDWKMQVGSATIQDIIISSSPVVMIFDLQTSTTTLPASYYYNIRSYMLNSASLKDCQDHSDKYDYFVCFYFGDLNDLPSLVFTLANETHLPLSPAAYMQKQSFGFSVTFRLHNLTLSGAEYIILGSEAMFQYYIVFQQLSSQTAGITIYPHPIDTAFDFWAEFDISNSDDTSINTIIEHSSFSSRTEDISAHEQSALSAENTTSAPQDEQYEKNGSDNTSFYIAFYIIFIVMICMLVVFVYRTKRSWIRKEKTEGRPESTLELNENSFFVTANNDVHSVDDGHDQM